MMKHDGLVEEARSELKQTQSRKITDIEEKDTEIQECQIRLSMQKNEMKRLHEIAQMSYEEELSKCFKLKLKLEQEVARSKEQQEMRNKSQSLTNQENKIDKQLSMSNPLLTDIMEFFYQKEKTAATEESLEDLISDLQEALEDTLQAEQKFREAAYFNPFDRQQADGTVINYADRKQIKFDTPGNNF